MDRAKISAYTLLELIVVMFSSAIVVAAVFAAWGAITRHTSTQSTRASLAQAADRITSLVAGDIRRYGTVLNAGEGVLRLESQSGDTLAYELSNDSILTRNETPVYTGLDGTKFAQFTAGRAGGDESYGSNVVGQAVLVAVTVQLVWRDSLRASGHIETSARAAQGAFDGYFGW